MNVRFGNLSIDTFESRTEVKLTDDDRAWMEEHREDSANKQSPDKFHIFDLPFSIVAGTGCGAELVKRLTSGGYEFKKSFQVEQLQE